MTREDIIRMAREADCLDPEHYKSLLIGASSTAPNYNLSFHKEGKEIGKLDFNGPTMVFIGDFDESAKVFFQWIAEMFQTRLERERAEEREECAKLARPAQWVGLMDEDTALLDWESFKTKKECVQAIEAALKEKNT